MKNDASFPSKICPVFKDVLTYIQPILKISQFLAAQLTGFCMSCKNTEGMKF